MADNAKSTCELAEAACSACLYYMKYDNSSDGQCRRHPPKITLLWGIKNTNAWWPETQPDNWCGEFQAKHIIRETE